MTATPQRKRPAAANDRAHAQNTNSPENTAPTVRAASTLAAYANAALTQYINAAMVAAPLLATDGVHAAGLRRSLSQLRLASDELHRAADAAARLEGGRHA